MSRFDEFRDSLEEAARSLKEAVDFLTDDDFENEEARYEETGNTLSLVCYCLKEAYQDICDDVGIRSDGDALKEICVLVEQLTDRVQADTKIYSYDDEYDEWHARKHVQSIRTLQHDIAEIIRVSW